MTVSTKIRGVLALVGIFLNTLLLVTPLYLFALLRLLLPFHAAQVRLSRVLVVIAETWMAINNAIIDLFSQVEWRVEGMDGLARQEWYLMTSNHQSWADILVLQKVTNRRVPSLKFFLKQELIWVPLLGLAWWALDFPFMHRHTKEQIAKRPELKGKDVAATQAACEKFRYTPVTIFNFMEGTRFTPEKHDRQNSPYKHLLKPRAGGTAFVLDAMGDMIHTMLDVTIVYPEGRAGFWDYLCGRIRRIIIDVRTREIPGEFLGMDYENNRETRIAFQRWVSQIWAEKDARIDELKAAQAPGPGQ